MDVFVDVVDFHTNLRQLIETDQAQNGNEQRPENCQPAEYRIMRQQVPYNLRLKVMLLRPLHYRLSLLSSNLFRTDRY